MCGAIPPLPSVFKVWHLFMHRNNFILLLLLHLSIVMPPPYEYLKGKKQQRRKSFTMKKGTIPVTVWKE
jgi:hypothetical protein